MISFEMEDLIGVLQGLVPYFIAIAVALVAAIAVTVAVKKLPQAKKKFIRGESWMAALLVIDVRTAEPGRRRRDSHHDLGQPCQRG